MKSYFLPSFIFKKKWVWFSLPEDVAGVDSVTFFSYEHVDVPGFHKKEGWTTIIDLFKPEKEIWGAFRPGFIAEQIQKGERRGILVKQDDNWIGFKNLYKTFREKKGIPKDDERLFESDGICFSAYLGDELLASGVFLADEQNLRAWALASKRLDGLDGKKKEAVGQANRMIIWEAIKYGRSKGLLRFDLGGIDIGDGSSTSPLTVFKEAFGGARVKNYYYSKVYSPLLNFIKMVKKIIKR